MNSQLNILTENLEKRGGLDETLLADFLTRLDFKLPNDYLEYMKNNNGGEGSIGKNSYLNLWSLENLFDWNKNYKVEIYAPGYFIFASDGGGTAYAFDKKEGSIVSFQFIGMLMDDEPIVLGNDFSSFLDYLYHN